MKSLVISGVVLLILILSIVYINSRLDYFGSDFEETNYWLSQNNPNIEARNSFETFDKNIRLYDFPRESEIFATVSYEDEFMDLHEIEIPWSLVGKSIYSTKEIDGRSQVKLLSTAEAIIAVAEWRTIYTFNVVRADTTLEKYHILSVYIHEPI